MEMIRARGEYEAGGKKMVQRRMRVLVRVHTGGAGARNQMRDARNGRLD